VLAVGRTPGQPSDVGVGGGGGDKAPVGKAVVEGAEELCVVLVQHLFAPDRGRCEAKTQIIKNK
jgi:hypothetical protein